MKQYIIDNIRIQILTNNIVRLEKQKNNHFEDENTFFICDRNFNNNDINASIFDLETNKVIKVNDYEIIIPNNHNGLKGIYINKDNEKVYAYKRIKNTGELPLLHKTPIVYPLMDNPRIICPKEGYSSLMSGKYKIDNNVEDIYLFLINKDFLLLRKLLVKITGRNDLVRLANLGFWNSRYFAYDENTAKQKIEEHILHNVPLDNLVIDTDWRKSSERGIGYDIDTNLFPDMKCFLDYAHSKNVEIMFNDHPEPYENAKNILDKKEATFREEKLQGLLKLGVDTWWYDRNWMTRLISPTKLLKVETLGDYAFSEITKHFYQEVAKNNEIYKRPVIMCNVNQILNGTYEAIKDSASHRYFIQWTGDIKTNYQSVEQELHNLIKGSNNLISYINFDCGGHISKVSRDTFIRFNQLATFSPIYRPHVTKDAQQGREPWIFDKECEETIKNYINMRYHLLPIIYREAYNSYLNGTPIFSSLGFKNPNDLKSLKNDNELMLSNNILVAPIYDNNVFKLDKSYYSSKVKVTYFDGTEFKGEPLLIKEYNDIDFCCNNTKPEIEVPMHYFSTTVETKITPKEDMTLIVESDDCFTLYIDGIKEFEDLASHEAIQFEVKKLLANKEYDIKIYYKQYGGEAVLKLYKKVDKISKKHFYLPQGNWIDAFKGKIYKGNKTYSRYYSLNEMPLFIKEGSLLPLARTARNTKEQKWNKLVLDYYPSKIFSDSNYLYEDDTYSTAYKLNEFRTSKYEAKFDKDRYVINLYKSIGSFNSEKCFNEREMLLKVHLLNGLKINKILINNEVVKYRLNSKKRNSFPLNDGLTANESKTATVKFIAKTNEDYKIEIIVEQ